MCFKGLNLNYEGKQRKGILTVGDDPRQRLDEAFHTVCVHGKVKDSIGEPVEIGLMIYIIPIITVEHLKRIQC